MMLIHVSTYRKGQDIINIFIIIMGFKNVCLFGKDTNVYLNTAVVKSLILLRYYYRRASTVYASTSNSSSSTPVQMAAVNQSGSTPTQSRPRSSPVSQSSPASQGSSSPEAVGAGDASAEPGGSGHSAATFSLSDFMSGVHVFFYNMAASDKKTLSRYLITYPFTCSGKPMNAADKLKIKPKIKKTHWRASSLLSSVLMRNNA